LKFLKKEKLWQELKGWFIAIGVALFLKYFVFQFFFIPSGSMIPTLLIGDLVLGEKISYRFKEPERGDIVIFYYPKDKSIFYIKRIVGLPGDNLTINGDFLVKINGKKVKYEYVGDGEFIDEGKKVFGKIYLEYLPLRYSKGYKKHYIFIERENPIILNVQVPENKYFVMGDNRDNSYDSRYWGFVDRKDINAKGVAVLISLNKYKYYLPRLNRILKIIE